MPENPLKIEQTAYSIALGHIKKEYIFDDDQLTYSGSDRTGESSIVIPYESIDLDQQKTVLVKNERFRRPMIAMFILGCYFVLQQNHLYLDQDAAATMRVLVGMVVGGGVIFFMARGGIKYTVFEGGFGRLFIISDAQHDEILRQIKAHWSAKLRRTHGQVNPASSPEKELQKFDWLKKHGVISEEEYQQALSIIRVLFVQTPLGNTPHLN